MADDRPILYSMDNRIRGMSSNDQPWNQIDLALAKAVADLVSEACLIVHDPSHVFLGDPSAPTFPDAVVDEMMRGLQTQLDREGKSRTSPNARCVTHGVHHEHWYTLANDLPRARQRALAERIYALYREWTDAGATIPVFREGDVVPGWKPSSGAYGGDIWYGDG